MKPTPKQENNPASKRTVFFHLFVQALSPGICNTSKPVTQSDSTILLTRFWHDSTNFSMTLARRACESDSANMTRAHRWTSDPALVPETCLMPGAGAMQSRASNLCSSTALPLAVYDNHDCTTCFSVSRAKHAINFLFRLIPTQWRFRLSVPLNCVFTLHTLAQIAVACFSNC